MSKLSISVYGLIAVVFLIVMSIYSPSIFGQENEVIVTIMQGSADAGSGENKYEGEAHVGYGFNPPELTIEKGTIVKWVNNDSSTHTVTSGKPSSGSVGLAFDSSYMNEGDVYLHKFNSKKTYDYYCTMYPFMKGKIIVE